MHLNPIWYVRRMYSLAESIIQVRRSTDQIDDLKLRVDSLQRAAGRIEARQTAAAPSAGLRQRGFRVYSQWDEDGIIQYLVNTVPVVNKVFVEFGVENYEESNTRFLLVNDNWRGLIIDGSLANIQHVKADSIYWLYDLCAECRFITAENINSIISDAELSGRIGLLSVDIDGNDYWVWKALTCVTPDIVVCEYNNIFGPNNNVVVPYAEHFDRLEAHYSNVYYGASLTALNQLAKSKGYSLIGSNSAGNNAFFVKDDVIGNIPVCDPGSVYVEGHYREALSRSGSPNFADFYARREMIGHLPIYDLNTHLSVPLSEVWKRPNDPYGE